MSRFSAKVEDQAFARSGGNCEECGGLLKPGKFEFDHKKPRGLQGDDTLANCVCLCLVCHLRKTLDEDMPQIRAADRKAKLKRGLPVAGGEPNLARRYK